MTALVIYHVDEVTPHPTRLRYSIDFSVVENCFPVSSWVTSLVSHQWYGFEG